MNVVYDPSDPSFGARSHEVFRLMRDHRPVYADPDGRFFALSRFEDVRSAALDWQTFSSRGKLEARYIKPTMSSLDPPDHAEIRAVVSRAFTPRRVAELESDIRSLAIGLIDEFIERGECDAIAEYSSLLPSMVIGRLIGIPDELVPVCRELTDDNMRKTSPAGAEQPAARSYEIFAELYDERRERPRDDLLSALLAAEINGRRLSEDELLAFGWLMLVGGNDTTTNLIGNGIDLLARHPTQRAELVENPSLLPNAIEEILRIESPTHTLPRTTAREAVLPHGVIPAGSRVLLLWASANLDEREFDDPESFDIHRRAPRHLALGHGLHFCLGASLARLEARVAFEEWLRRIPEYQVAHTPEYIVSSTFHGFEQLPIVFEKGS
jgi:cytochrome P450 family 130